VPRRSARAAPLRAWARQAKAAASSRIVAASALSRSGGHLSLLRRYNDICRFISQADDGPPDPRHERPGACLMLAAPLLPAKAREGSESLPRMTIFTSAR
jgi:hypothetical protein